MVRRLFTDYWKLLFIHEHVDISGDVERDEQQWESPDKVGPQFGGERNTRSGVGFLNEVIKAPAHSGYAEEDVTERAQGQKIIGEDEVFQVEDHGTGPHGIEP